MQRESLRKAYEPPKEIAEAIRKQFKEQQKLKQEGPSRSSRPAYLPQRTWIQRNPRLFQGLFIGGSLLVFFSKPLYDCFLAPSPSLEDLQSRPAPPPPHRLRKARQRLQNYPVLLGKCAASATKYAACVTRDLNVQQKACDQEFNEFKLCLQQAAKDMKTKL